MLYYVYLVYCGILLLCLIIVIIIILAVDSVVGGGCEGDYCDGVDTVDDAARVFLIILVVIWACIYVPITLIALECVYYGWKEMEHKDEKKEKEKAKDKKKKAE